MNRTSNFAMPTICRTAKWWPPVILVITVSLAYMGTMSLPISFPTIRKQKYPSPDIRPGRELGADRHSERPPDVHPLGIYRPDTLFLPHCYAHESGRDRKQSTLRKRFLFPEQYIRHETALQIQQPFCRYHLRPSRNSSFRPADYLRSGQKP